MKRFADEPRDGREVRCHLPLGKATSLSCYPIILPKIPILLSSHGLLRKLCSNPRWSTLSPRCRPLLPSRHNHYYAGRCSPGFFHDLDRQFRSSLLTTHAPRKSTAPTPFSRLHAIQTSCKDDFSLNTPLGPSCPCAPRRPFPSLRGSMHFLTRRNVHLVSPPTLRRRRLGLLRHDLGGRLLGRVGIRRSKLGRGGCVTCEREWLATWPEGAWCIAGQYPEEEAPRSQAEGGSHVRTRRGRTAYPWGIQEQARRRRASAQRGTRRGRRRTHHDHHPVGRCPMPCRRESLVRQTWEQPSARCPRAGATANSSGAGLNG